MPLFSFAIQITFSAVETEKSRNIWDYRGNFRTVEPPDVTVATSRRRRIDWHTRSAHPPRAQLADLNCVTLEAENPKQTLALLERETVAPLVSDVIMPGGMNGFELAALALARWPGLKLLLTSGFSGGLERASRRVVTGAKCISHMQHGHTCLFRHADLARTE